MASTAHAVKVALVEKFAAALPGVQVSFGDPGRDIERECVFLGDVEFDQDWATLGALKKEETYTIDCWVLITTPGASEMDASARTSEVTAVIESVLRERANISGLAGTREIAYRDGSTQGRPTQEGRIFGHQFSIRCIARI